MHIYWNTEIDNVINQNKFLVNILNLITEIINKSVDMSWKKRVYHNLNCILIWSHLFFNILLINVFRLCIH